MELPYTLEEKSMIRKQGSEKNIDEVKREAKSWVESFQRSTGLKNKFYYVNVFDAETRKSNFVYSDAAKEYFGLEEGIIDTTPGLKVQVETGGILKTPIGVILWSAADINNEEYKDYMICDGRELLRSEYSVLFGLIGTSFGEGDGSTTFNIPNLQDEFVRGTSDTRPVGMMEDWAVENWEAKFATDLGSLSGCIKGLKVIKSKASAGAQGQRDTLHRVSPDYAVKTADETRPMNVALNPIIKVKDTPKQDVYSYEETLTDKVWIGKPVYRKIFTLESIAARNDYYKIEVDIPIDRVVKLDYSSKTVDGQVKGSSYSGVNQDVEGVLLNTNGNISIYNRVSDMEYIDIVLEYTKKED